MSTAIRLPALRLPSLALAGALVLSAPAVAHHGWSWAEAEQMTLRGTIRTISMAPPTPRCR